MFSSAYDDQFFPRSSLHKESILVNSIEKIYEILTCDFHHLAAVAGSGKTRERQLPRPPYILCKGAVC